MNVRIGAMIRNVYEANVHVSIFSHYEVELLEVHMVHDHASIVLPIVAFPLEHPAGINGVHQELRCRENGQRINAHLIGQIDGMYGGLNLANTFQSVSTDGLTPVAVVVAITAPAKCTKMKIGPSSSSGRHQREQ